MSYNDDMDYECDPNPRVKNLGLLLHYDTLTEIWTHIFQRGARLTIECIHNWKYHY